MTNLHQSSTPSLKPYQEQFAKAVSGTYPGKRLSSLDETNYRFYADKSGTTGRLAVAADGRVLTDTVRQDPYPRGLPYSDTDFRDAIKIALGSTGSLSAELNTLIAWESEGPDKAVLRSLPGEGKSHLLGILTATMSLRRRIFCFHTRAKRNEFWKRHLTDEQRRSGFRRIFSNLDIVRFYTKASHRKAVKKVFQNAYDELAPMEFWKLVQRCVKKGLLTDETAKIVTEVHKQQQEYILSSEFSLVMCTAKFRRSAARLSPIDWVVYIDEVVTGELTEFPTTTPDPYNSEKIVLLGRPEFDPVHLRAFKTCYVTCEQVIEHELRKLAGEGLIEGWQTIGSVSKCFEPGLTILWSSETSSRVPTKADISKRRRLVVKLKGMGHFVIANNSGADANHVNSVGRNDLRNPKNAVIASYPPREVLCKIMLATGLSRAEAESLYISDTANQGVGRNMGFRKVNESDECLLIMPKNISKQYLSLDFVTDQILTDEATDDDSLVAPEESLPMPRPGDLLHDVWPDVHPTRAKTILRQMQVDMELVKVGKRHGNLVKLAFRQVGCDSAASHRSVSSDMAGSGAPHITYRPVRHRYAKAGGSIALPFLSEGVPGRKRQLPARDCEATAW